MPVKCIQKVILRCASLNVNKLLSTEFLIIVYNVKIHIMKESLSDTWVSIL